EDAELADLRQTEERPALPGHGAVEGDHAADLFGERQGQAIRERRALGETCQADSLRVNGIVPARLLDGAGGGVFDGLVVAAVAPAVAESAVAARTEQYRTAQTDADVVASAQARGQSQDLLLIAAQTVEEHQQRVRIAGLVAGGQEGPYGQGLRRGDLARVKPFFGFDGLPGEIRIGHENPRRAKSAR